jgi:hypothetical protein
MRLPIDWNHPRATAFAATLFLHVAAILWLLALRFDVPERLAGDLAVLWQAMPEAAPIERPLPPVPTDARPPDVTPRGAAPLAPPPPHAPPDEEGWSNIAKDAARRLTTSPSYQPFGEFPKGPEEKPSELYPPSIFDKPLPRVGTTVTTAEGETIIWVSDYCYVSVQSRSLTLKEIHAARNGVRTCILAQFGGDKRARGDLFDPIKAPPLPQEPGCNGEGIGLSCSR